MITSMQAPQVLWDNERDEPYIPLANSPEVRLTPWRVGDEDEAMKLFNDATVGKYAQRRPYPYLRKDLSFYPDVIIPASVETINTILRPIRSSPLFTIVLSSAHSKVPFFPFIIIRHHPSGKLIGDIQIFQLTDNLAAEDLGSAFGGAVPQPLPPAEQIWEISYNLLPEWRGKGVAGQVLDAVIEGWVKWVGIGRLMAGIESANVASAGLVRSRGFTKDKTMLQEWPEEKGGGMREMSEWVLKL